MEYDGDIFRKIVAGDTNEFELSFDKIDVSDKRLLTDIAVMIIFTGNRSMMLYMILYQFKHKIDCFPYIEDVYYYACKHDFMWQDLFFYLKSVNNRTLSGKVPLIAAFKSKNIDIVTFLLDNGADINLCYNECYKIAVDSGDIDLTMIVLEFFKDSQSMSFLTPNGYFSAAYNMDIPMLLLLKDYMVPSHRIDKDSYLALKNAIYDAQIEDEDYLIDYINGEEF